MDKIVMCGYSVHRQYTSQGEKGRFYAFRLQSHGECDARLNGEPLRLKKGDLLMMVPGDRLAIHKPFNAADASDTSGDYYLLCQGDWIASWFRRLNGRRHLEVPTGESILDLWKLIIRETHRLPDAADGAYLEALLHAFCLSVEHLLHRARGGQSEFVVSRMKRYIEDHAFEKLRVAEVAAAASLSESRALHLFREVTGQSVVDYLTDVRLNYALDQMKYTDSTLEEIAENTGFGTYTYFHRVFKRKMGEAPGAYRQKYRREEATL